MRRRVTIVSSVILAVAVAGYVATLQRPEPPRSRQRRLLGDDSREPKHLKFLQECVARETNRMGQLTPPSSPPQLWRSPREMWLRQDRALAICLAKQKKPRRVA